MADVSKEKLIGSIMPDAYIDSVILETAGGEWPDLRVQNDRLAPHITDIEDAQLLRQTRQRFEGTPQKSLKISVSILLKDLLAKDATTSWFLKNDFVNFLSYVVVISTSKRVTDLLLRLDDGGDRSVFLGDAASGAAPSGRILRTNLKSILTDTTLNSLIDNHLDAKMGSVEIPQDNEVREEPYTETDSTGKQLYNFFFTESFDYSQLEPDHLTVFAYTIFDIDAYFESLNVSGQIKNRLKDIADKTVSLLRVNTIIDRSKVVSDSVILRFVDNDEIYVGKWHVMGNGAYMSGRNHHPGSRMLYSELVPNDVVQDFRNFEEFKPNVVDLSSLQEDIFPSMSRLFRDRVKDNLNTSGKSNYFSDIWMSRGLGGECQFAFVMNFKKMCKKNTKYPKVVQHNSALLGSHFKIQSFKILRRRVEEIKKPLGRGNDPGNTVDDPDSRSLIIFESGEYNKSIGAKTNSDTVVDIPDEIISTEPNVLDGTIRTRQGKNNIKELQLSQGTKGSTLEYTVSDGSIVDIANGKYQYGIEIKIQDLVAVHISTFLGQMLYARNELLEYLVIAQKPVNRKRRAAVGQDNPHIKWQEREKDLITAKLEDQGNFDVAANRFTQNFVQKWATTGARPWINAATTTIRALNLLFSSVNLPRGLTPAFFEKVCRPESGSPDGIRSVIYLMEEVITSLSKLIDTPVSQKGTAVGSVPAPRGSSSGSQLQAGSPQKDVFTIMHYFDNDVFDASYPKDTGYYYLLAKEDDVNLQKQRRNYGLRTLSVGEFEARLESDERKFVIEGLGAGVSQDRQPAALLNLNISPADKYKSLTPSRVSLIGSGGSSVNFLDLGLPTAERIVLDGQVQSREAASFGEDSYNSFSAIAAQIANLKSPAGQPFVSIARGARDSDSIRDNLVEVLADKGCTIGKPDDKFFFSQGVPRVAAESRNSATSVPTADIPRTSTTTGRPAGRVYSVPTSPDVRSGADPDLNISEMFGADSPVTADVGSENVGDTRSIADIIGIHKTEDTDLFNAGPVFLRLLMNVVFEDEELRRRTRRILPTLGPQPGSGIFADMFDVTTMDSQTARYRPGGLAALLRDLPIAIKALFLSSVEEAEGNLNFVLPADEDVFQDPLKAMVYYFNFFSTVKLEVFKKFERVTVAVPTQQAGTGAQYEPPVIDTESEISLKEDRWAPLTPQDFSNLGENSDLLIRMTPYENDWFKIKQLPGLKLDMFSSYFVVRKTIGTVAVGALVSAAATFGSERPTAPGMSIRSSGPILPPGTVDSVTPPVLFAREYASSDPRLGRAAAQAPSAATLARQRAAQPGQEVTGLAQPPRPETRGSTQRRQSQSRGDAGRGGRYS